MAGWLLSARLWETTQRSFSRVRCGNGAWGTEEASKVSRFSRKQSMRNVKSPAFPGTEEGRQLRGPRGPQGGRSVWFSRTGRSWPSEGQCDHGQLLRGCISLTASETAKTSFPPGTDRTGLTRSRRLSVLTTRQSERHELGESQETDSRRAL